MRLPVALQSLLIQLVALAAAVLAARLAQPLLPSPFSLWQLAIAQGAVAGALSLVWRQPRWWLPLHAGFLPAILAATSLDLPAWIYLAGFLLLAGFFWTTARTRVPLYLSDRKAWDAIAATLPADRPFRFIDLGSGLGGLLFDLEQRFPLGRFTGVEVAPASWWVSRLRARLRGSRVELVRRDYAALDLGEYDVVFAFLSPAAMPALWQQLSAQMHPGGCFMSLSFRVPGVEPDATVAVAPHPRHRLYVWRFPGGKK